MTLILWENPILVPKEAPDGKEAGRNKEANVGANANIIEAADDGVVEAEANGFNKDVAAHVLHLAQVFALRRKCPITLYEIVKRPANDVGGNFRRQPGVVEAGITDCKNGVATPKI